MERYHLTIHPDKTRLLNFTEPDQRESKGQSTFDFVGFRHYWGKSRKSRWVVKRKTAPNRVRRTLRRIWDWCQKNRHLPVREQHRILSAKLRGHYNYFGVTGNARALTSVYFRAVRAWRYWLNRRGSRPVSWERFKAAILVNLPLPPPRVAHSVYAIGK